MRIARVVEEGIELIILPVRNRIIFVRVALAAVQRQPHPHGPSHGNAVLHRFRAELLRVGTTGGIVQCVAMKRRGDPVIRRSVDPAGRPPAVES